MARRMPSRITALLLALALVALSCGVDSVSADVAVAQPRRLRSQDVEDKEEVAASASVSGSAVADTGASNTTGNSTEAASASTNSTDAASANTEASASATESTSSEGPSTMSFVGPMIAGVLAIVLIGAVVAFKNRMAN